MCEFVCTALYVANIITIRIFVCYNTHLQDSAKLFLLLNLLRLQHCADGFIEYRFQAFLCERRTLEVFDCPNLLLHL